MLDGDRTEHPGGLLGSLGHTEFLATASPGCDRAETSFAQTGELVVNKCNILDPCSALVQLSVQV